jgi:hypothetical protein
MFNYCVNDEDQSEERREMAWQSLVHVCRRWRSIIFGSPRHLKLQLICTRGTPTRDTLDVWPALPLVILCYNGYNIENLDNVFAVLERSDRVCRITLWEVESSDLEITLAEMQQPLTYLWIWPEDNSVSGRSRFVPGWIRPTSGIPPVVWHSISGITETTFVYHSPRQSSPYKYSPFRIHFTRGNGHCPLLVDQPRTSYAQIRISSILPRPGKPTSASFDTLCPSRSHKVSVQGCHRIFGGPCGPHRFPSTQQVSFIILQ